MDCKKDVEVFGGQRSLESQHLRTEGTGPVAKQGVRDDRLGTCSCCVTSSTRHGSRSLQRLCISSSISGFNRCFRDVGKLCGHLYASHSASSLRPSAEFPRLCAESESTAHDYHGACRFVGSLLVRLDSTKAVAWKSRPFEIAAGAGISATSSVERVASVALSPSFFPLGTFLVVSASEETHAWFEPAVFEALEALVEACEMSFTAQAQMQFQLVLPK